MDAEPRLPAIHIVKIEDGEVDVVTSPICDFCGDSGPEWDYGCEDFVLPGIPSPFGDGDWASMGHWCVCGPCSRMIDSSQLGQLMQRMMINAPAHIKLEWAKAIIGGFLLNMTGEKEPFG